MFKESGAFQKPKSPENFKEKLDGMMSVIAQKLNAEFQALGENQALLNSDNAINMEAFRPGEKTKGKRDRNKNKLDNLLEAQSVTNEEEPVKALTFVDADKERIRNKNIEFSAADNPSTQLHYIDEFGVKNDENIVDNVIEQFKKNNEKKLSFLLEKAVIALFYRLLDAEFMVMRSSTYDDYFNGIDNVIVNRKTGAVICAIDEVHSEIDGERLSDKIQKVERIAKDDGATLKYGVMLKKDASTGAQKLVKRPIENIPVFYIGLSAEELKSLLSGMNYDVNGKINQIEFDIFDKIMISLEDQIIKLSTVKKSSDKPLHDGVKKNIAIFKDSVRQMKKLRVAKKIDSSS
ncbi:MAG: hypothetical protein WAV73_01330 [Candidatus Moraniibacteriota bacterium]